MLAASLALEASALNEPTSGALANPTAVADAGSLAIVEINSRQPRLSASRISLIRSSALRAASKYFSFSSALLYGSTGTTSRPSR